MREEVIKGASRTYTLQIRSNLCPNRLEHQEIAIFKLGPGETLESVAKEYREDFANGTLSQ